MAVKSIRQWQYYVSSAQLTVSGRSYNIPQERFKSFEITEDYEGYIFPLFKMTVVLEPSRYYMVLEHKDDCYFNLNIRKRYTNPGSQSTRGDSEFINGRFEAIIDDNVADTQYMDKLYASNKNYRNMVNKDISDLQATSNVVEFYLFKHTIIKAFKEQNINVLFKEATVADGIGYLFKKAGINNVLFAPPDNTNRYEFFLIPPSTILKSFTYIDAYYGIYKSGSLIFFGIEKSFIIPYSSRCEVYEKDGIQEIWITVPSSSTTDITNATSLGECIQEGGGIARTFTCDQKMIQIYDDEKSNDYIAGNDASIYEPITGEYSTSSNSSSSSGNAKTYVRLLENLTENKYIGTMYIARSSGNSITLSVPFEDIDASVFTPNKKYKLTFNDSKILYTMKNSQKRKANNKYAVNFDYFMLSKIEHKFINSGSSFLLNSVGFFKYPV
jgi:hypothetical protein